MCLAKTELNSEMLYTKRNSFSYNIRTYIHVMYICRFTNDVTIVYIYVGCVHSYAVVSVVLCGRPR